MFCCQSTQSNPWIEFSLSCPMLKKHTLKSIRRENLQSLLKAKEAKSHIKHNPGRARCLKLKRRLQQKELDRVSSVWDGGSKPVQAVVRRSKVLAMYPCAGLSNASPVGLSRSPAIKSRSSTHRATLSSAHRLSNCVSRITRKRKLDLTVPNIQHAPLSSVSIPVNRLMSSCNRKSSSNRYSFAPNDSPVALRSVRKRLLCAVSDRQPASRPEIPKKTVSRPKTTTARMRLLCPRSVLDPSPGTNGSNTVLNHPIVIATSSNTAAASSFRPLSFSFGQFGLKNNYSRQ